MSDEKMKMSEDADYRFLSLMMSLATAAWSQLGKVPNPVTQKIEKDVEQARISIEFLRMLQEKTEGNLSVKEEELLNNTVSDLELNFADEIRKSDSDKATANKGPDIIIPPGASKGPEIIKP
jgi:uncharacterized protein DUF1844